MILALNLEFKGNCRDIIQHYNNIFPGSRAEILTYDEMPMADVYGITKENLSMVWKSTLTIDSGKYSLCLEMSDSLLAAMNNYQSTSNTAPLLLIEHKSIEDVRALFDKLYQGKHGFNESTVNYDEHGIIWNYRQNENPGIFYCFDFDGYCCDVINYYENAFNIKAKNIIRYCTSPYAGEVSGSGADKIYSAVLEFRHGDRYYAMELSDTLDSAKHNLNKYDPKALLFYKNGNPVLCLKDSDRAYLTESFTKLSAGAKLNKPISPGEDGGLHGSLIDRYGICWEFIKS